MAYTAFVYGDPSIPNSEFLNSGVVLNLRFGLQFGAVGNPVPVGAALSSGSIGTAYSETITASGGTSPYAYAVTSGALPTGLSMSSVGLISGIPTVVGTYNFTVTVTDAQENTGSQPFSITIAKLSVGGNYGWIQ
jgi:hypothetical protein